MVNTENHKQDYRGVIRVSITDVMVEAYLIKPWKKPFGWKNLTINEAGISLGISYDGSPNIGVVGNYTMVESSFKFVINYDTLNP